MSDMTHFFDHAFSTLGAAIGTQFQVTGPAFAYHLRRPGDTAELEVGFPVPAPFSLDPAVPIVCSSLPGGTVARWVHHGSFDGLPGAWEAFLQSIEEQGYRPGPSMWEIYVTEPTPTMDPADLRTELRWPAQPVTKSG